LLIVLLQSVLTDFKETRIGTMETQTPDRLDQAVAQIESEIWQELQKIDPDQRRSVEIAGLEAMRDKIRQRVRCLTTGEDCGATIAGVDLDWF
jgi:hypothetical protein